MIKIDDLIDELNKYEIPNEDEAISWFINGDKNATLENWRFYQRCILGMLHIDEHFGSACKTKADFEQLEMLLKLRNSQTDVTNEIKNLIDAFLSSDSVSKSRLFENNELINYIKLFAETSNLPFYNVEVDESKVREIKASIKQYNEIIKKFELYLYEEERSGNTIEKYMRDIRFFREWLNGRNIDKSVVIEYKKELCERYAVVDFYI